MKRTFLLFLVVPISLLMVSTVYSLPTFYTTATDYDGEKITVGTQYGDFYAWSLPLLDYYHDGGGYQPGSDWYVSQPKEPIVVYNNSNNVVNNLPGMDNYWESVTGNPNDQLAFDPSISNEPDPELVGDSDTHWDIEFGALDTFLTNDDDTISDMVLFFNNNQQGGYNKDTGEYEQSLFGWGQVQLVDLENELPTVYFDFNSQTNSDNDPTQYDHGTYYAEVSNNDIPADPFIGYGDPGDLVRAAGDLYVLPEVFDDGDPSNDPIYILVQGVDALNLGFISDLTDQSQFYVKEFDLLPYAAALQAYQKAYQDWIDGGQTGPEPGAPAFPDFLAAERIADLIKISTNLGRAWTEVAISAPELNELLRDLLGLDNYGGYDMLRIGMQLDFLNNGPEQLFMIANPGEYEYVIPEPATLLLFGLGLIGIAGLGRRKQG